MTDLPLGRSDSRRQVARTPSIVLKNRYFESNPIQNDEGASAISRPVLKFFRAVGSGPIHKIFSEPGAFSDKVFILSGVELYTISSAGAAVFIGTVAGTDIHAVDMAVVAAIGATPERLFLCEGGLLYYYSVAAGLTAITMPSSYAVSSIAHINSYIIVAIEEGQGVNGRFYWIEPGEITVDTLNFATAERSPDAVQQVIVFSDMFWLLGAKTAEPWQTTGNIDAPVRRFEGILYDRGCWAGTAVQVKDSLILADQDGAVFQIQGGLKRISRPDIEERIRKAIQGSLT